jgi:manganese efflux pump family protein
MSFGGVLALAVALAMDATAVAGARGLAAPEVRLRHALLVGVLFGGAQALMPALGWLLGDRLGPWVAAWDHWVAFVLLAGIGVKMLWEARQPPASGAGGFQLRVLLVLALATSVDAFAAGITLPMIGAPLLLSLVTIGLVTALLSAGAVLLGRRFGARWGRRLDALGGAALILLGVKILVQHLRG